MDKNLRLEVLEKLTALITSGFGLVAALAWNDAIKELINALLPQPSLLWGKIIYAIIITILVVFFTVNLGRIVNKLKVSLNEEKEEEKNN